MRIRTILFNHLALLSGKSGAALLGGRRTQRSTQALFSAILKEHDRMLGFAKMLNISLPERVRAFVEIQASASGFSSVNEYVYHLILREQERIAERERIESLLLDGLDSGEPVEVTEDWWEQKRACLLERVQEPRA